MKIKVNSCNVSLPVSTFKEEIYINNYNVLDAIMEIKLFINISVCKNRDYEIVNINKTKCVE